MSIKIDKKIIAYDLKKADATPEPACEKKIMHEEIKRPEELNGYTYKIKTPLSDHALYITINNIILNPDSEHEQEHPFEIFINSKNMEHFQWVLALTRVISAVFRKGGDVTFMVEELKQIFDPQGGYFKKGGRFMPSLVAEIGETLEVHMKKCRLIKDEELHPAHRTLIAEKTRASIATGAANAEDPYPPGARLCKRCNTQAVVLLDGCMTCLSCGDSKCG